MNKTSEDVDVIDHGILCQSYFRLDRYRLRHRKFDGAWSEVIEREIFERGKCAAVLLYDPDRNEVVLVEQFRIGLQAAGDAKPWTLEIVAGILEQNEEAVDLVHREAQEEAGLAVAALTKMPGLYASPGGSSEYIHMYCGKVDASTAGGIHGLDDEGEDIRVVTINLEDALAAIDDGRINTAFTMTALMWFARHRERIVEGWRAED